MKFTIKTLFMELYVVLHIAAVCVTKLMRVIVQHTLPPAANLSYSYFRGVNSNHFNYFNPISTIYPNFL